MSRTPIAVYPPGGATVSPHEPLPEHRDWKDRSRRRGDNVEGNEGEVRGRGEESTNIKKRAWRGESGGCNIW